mmetsp:Transcript_41828/g.77721  ORF Transcript_41828/g.77721 Transcript_41828/m.77721 type:complete len:301 (+) Transcript_41828:55-957(+)
MKVGGCFLVLCLNVLVASSHSHKHGQHPHAQKHHKDSQKRLRSMEDEETVTIDEEVVLAHRQKLRAQRQEIAEKLRGHQSAAQTETPLAPKLSFVLDSYSNRGAAESNRGGEEQSQPPISAKLTKAELDEFLHKLSEPCQKQFTSMLEGHGKASALHHFGKASQNSTADTCSSLGGALCNNHARILQTTDVPDGRKMVAKSVVDGKSCLPSKCVQDADLRMLASMLQQKAVESLGPASEGQQPVEVLLDVDCTSSGGSSYYGKSAWSMEEAGPTRSAGMRQTLRWAWAPVALVVGSFCSA